MTSRVLPESEWPRLAHTDASEIYRHMDPSRTSIVVVEKDGAIVGCHVLMHVLHVECLWIDPAFRGRPSVARRLWGAVQAQAKALGARTMVTAACDDRIRGLLSHVGATRIPGEQYVIAVKG